ncbi:hypothetical protein B0T22DRAFT_531172 [Podospora appendiculata]|uniref:Fe2OG dioxygenase domain-containing protein n=1 Tax=Podospora appendiculata TaxID=314037 RepID=A0AAE0X0B1_9PEZI|nr:hypothetical protein B0T22DRAFT_531172 [Podospora appendiculata]
MQKLDDGAGRAAIVTVDLSPFTDTSLRDFERLEAGQALVEACHNLGFVKITGHGFTKEELDVAFAWTKRLFDLSYEEKMTAPHPPGPMPHRGYSGIGVEKIYSKEDMENPDCSKDVGQELRKIMDFKARHPLESYEIGSEQDDQQQNIWLPHEVLPGFQDYMNSLYERLAGVGKMILAAFGVGLGLDPDATTALMHLCSERHCQLRLLHYPDIEREKLLRELVARLPPHTDWSTFTMLFQDNSGGLELRDPSTQQFLHARPEEGVLVLNIGDMFQRFSNDHFVSALHRVAVPEAGTVSESRIPARYSIPFFVSPAPSHTVETLPQFVAPGTPIKYAPIKFQDYNAFISKYQYQSGGL